MALNNALARDVFYTTVNEVYQDRMKPKGFFTSLAKEKKTAAKTFSIEVRRYFEKASIDIIRGGSANKNEFALSTQKAFLPPYYEEEFDMTELQNYDRLFGTADEIDGSVLNSILDSANEKAEIIADKIRRSIEIQGSQVHDTGIVNLESNVDIDFKRDADSKPDIGATDPTKYWGNANAQIIQDLNTGAKRCRTKGKTGKTQFDVVMGENAWKQFLADETIQKFINFRRSDLIDVTTSRQEQNGAVLKCIFGPGIYTYNIWVHEDYYDDADGNAVPYWDSNKVCMFPSDNIITLNYAGVPVKYQPPNPLGGFNDVIVYQEADIHFFGYTDAKGTSLTMNARSAPLYTLISIDRLYSFTACEDTSGGEG